MLTSNLVLNGVWMFSKYNMYVLTKKSIFVPITQATYNTSSAYLWARWQCVQDLRNTNLFICSQTILNT